MTPDEVEIAIVGAGIAGIATAYYLCTEHGIRDLMILDPWAPMNLTTARSGENYRNWWPHPTMVAFTDSSIDLMERIARERANAIRMTRRGYALATRADDVGGLVASLEAGYGATAAAHIRMVDTARAGARYVGCAPHGAEGWELAPNGIDVITETDAIRRHFPHYADDVRCVLHVRRAGDVSAQQMGQFMLETVRGMGGRLRLGRLVSVERNGKFALQVASEGGSEQILAETLVNAAGPFLAEVAAMLDVTLPTQTIFQQKIAFRDRAGAIPRRMAFAVDLDPQVLDWKAEERDLLGADPSNEWLTDRFPGGIHCRPEGGEGGDWIKLGWAFNRAPTAPQWEPACDERFPEVVLRGAAALQPALKAYYGRLPVDLSHYGGYYTMTPENWPLIGPMGPTGAFVVGALSGYGTMSAAAAGSLCASWIAGAELPDYAAPLSLARYADDALVAKLRETENKGVL
ncbi:MAG TPA: FAD-binding oxidoreductase [Rhodospirillales bacterium]|jgi:glycine/D-amino acid oxidase-like deaminating enzyme|nr:FAD-binding oxidoreductase [Rhodospirillales bacterium]HJO68409.1 FAD-binding oxidoreductase [Rhodospirillales bacterium]